MLNMVKRSLNFMVACIALAGTSSASAQTVSAQSLLLHPRVRVGETLRWTSKLETKDPSSSTHDVVTHADSQTIVFLCSITTKIDDSITVGRRADILFKTLNSAAPTQIDAPIVIRSGHEFTLGGRPLNDDPLCKFYSASAFGEPPSHVELGTSWRYRQPGDYEKNCPGNGQKCSSGNLWITVKVTRLDSAAGIVGLHVAGTLPHQTRVVEERDTVYVDGGIVLRESAKTYRLVRTSQSDDVTPMGVLTSTLTR
jgi:hypothetical protein